MPGLSPGAIRPESGGRRGWLSQGKAESCLAKKVSRTVTCKRGEAGLGWEAAWSEPVGAKVAVLVRELPGHPKGRT